MEMDYTDRIYKTIDAEIGKDKFIRFLSKIDKEQNVTAEFYHYHKADIDNKDGTIKNKRNRNIIKSMKIEEFDEMIRRFPELYPNFKILGTIDYSDLTLNEAIKIIENFGYGKIIDLEKNKK